MTLAVVVSPEVEAQVRRIDAWWRAHRSLAPDLFLEEFAATCELLSGAPWIGRRYSHADVPDVRRILLRSTRYHVYYRVEGNSVVVLSVWGAVRGSGPELT